MSSSKGEKPEKAKKKSKSTSDDSTGDDSSSTTSDDSKKIDNKNSDEKSKSGKDKKKKKKIKKTKSDLSASSVGSGSSYYYNYDSDSSLSSSDSEINLLSKEVKKKKFRRVMAKEASKSSLLDSASKRGSSMHNMNRRSSLFSDDDDDSADLEEAELTEFHMDLTYLKASFQHQSCNTTTSDSVVSKESSLNTAPAALAITTPAKKPKPGNRVDSDDPDTKSKEITRKEKKYRRHKKEDSGEDTDSDAEPSIVFDWASIRTKGSGDSVEGALPKRKKLPAIKKVKEGTKKKKEGGDERTTSNGSGELKLEVEKHDWEAFSQGAGEDAKKKDKPKRNKNNEKESKALDDDSNDAVLSGDEQLIYQWTPKKATKSPAKKSTKPKKGLTTEGSPSAIEPLDLTRTESKNEEVSTPKAKRSVSTSEKNSARSTQQIVPSTENFFDGETTGILPITKFSRSTSLQEGSKLVARKLKLSQKLEKIKNRDAATSITMPGPSSDYNSDGENTAIHALTQLTRASISSPNNGDKSSTKDKIALIAEKTSDEEKTDTSTTLPLTGLTAADYYSSDGENTAIHALTRLTRAISAPVKQPKSDYKVKTASKLKKSSHSDTPLETTNSSTAIHSPHSFDELGEVHSSAGSPISGEESNRSNEPTTAVPDKKQKRTSRVKHEAINGEIENMDPDIGPADTVRTRTNSMNDTIQILSYDSLQLGPAVSLGSSAHSNASGEKGLGDEVDFVSKGSNLSGNSATPPDVVLLSDVSCGSKDSTRNGKKIKSASLSKSPKGRRKSSISKADLELQPSSAASKEEDEALSAYVSSILKTFTADPKEYSDESMIALLKEFPQAAHMKVHLESSNFRPDKGKTRHYLLSLLCALGASREATELCFRLHPDAIHKFDEHVGTPLHYTISYGILASFSREMWTDSIFETVEFLLEQEPRLLLSQHNHMRQTVLHQAILSLCPPPSSEPAIRDVDEQQNLAGISDVVISMLLENDNSIATLPDVKNRLPLHVAAQCVVPPEILRRLLKENRAACTVKCIAKGFTPLHYAVEVFAAAASKAPAEDAGTKSCLGVHISNIKTLLVENPSAAQMQDINGDLPLHLLVSGFYGHYSFESEDVRCDNPDSAFVKVMEVITRAFPESANISGSHGKTPQRIVEKHKGNAAVVKCMTDAMLPESDADEAKSG